MTVSSLRAAALLAIGACAPRPVNSALVRAEPTELAAPFASARRVEPAEPATRSVKFAPTSAQTVPLQVPGFLPAVLFVPEGNESRPLVVSTQGAGGSPEGACAYWVELTEGRAFVLALRGTAFNGTDSAFFYRDHLALGRELTAALGAARSAFGPRFAPGAGVYSGFSQGATMGVGMIPPFGAELPHLVMIEGGYDYWSVAHARKFAKRGGKRVLFACGTSWCAGKATKAAEWLRQAGLEARVEYAPAAGHTPQGAVLARVRAALPWVVSGQSSWGSQ